MTRTTETKKANAQWEHHGPADSTLPYYVKSKGGRRIETPQLTLIIVLISTLWLLMCWNQHAKPCAFQYMKQSWSTDELFWPLPLECSTIIFTILPLFQKQCNSSGVFSSQKFSPQNITSNLAAHAWSIKCRRNKKLIAQFTVKSRDESFKPN
jgi:hypothetical protein